jgi:hypothetical protein
MQPINVRWVRLNYPSHYYDATERRLRALDLLPEIFQTQS